MCTFSTPERQKRIEPPVFDTFDFQMRFAPQRRALFRHLNFEKWSEAGVCCSFWLGNVLRATPARTFSTSQLRKMIRSWCALYILTWKYASHHTGAHFFRHLNFQKWSEPGVLCTFCLGNVLRATTACNFSSFIWLDGSAPAALASLLFDHPEPQIIGKQNESRLSYLFAHLHLLSSHSFSSLLFSLLDFSSLTLPTSAFPSVHIVGSLTSKLPSIVFNNDNQKITIRITIIKILNPPTPLWRWRRAYWVQTATLTFVNIAVAISALAGGGPLTVSHRDQN